MAVRVFTLEEANRLLPTIEEAIQALRDGFEGIVRRQDALVVLDVIGASAPASPEHAEFVEQQKGLDEALTTYNARLEEIQKIGCVLRDINAGIVDFYGVKEGRLIFLCWRSGEPSVAYWHEINAGMVGRRPVSEL